MDRFIGLLVGAAIGVLVYFVYILLKKKKKYDE